MAKGSSDGGRRTVETVNCAPDFMAGRQLIDKGVPVAAEAIGDVSVPLRDILKGVVSHG
ncbi:MAG: oxidoreductase C-terminal domain-containing protein [Tetrasphaera sp.]